MKAIITIEVKVHVNGIDRGDLVQAERSLESKIKAQLDEIHYPGDCNLTKVEVNWTGTNMESDRKV